LTVTSGTFLGAVESHDEPFTWFRLSGPFAFDPGVLADRFPATGFTAVQAEGDKSYSMNVRPLLDRSERYLGADLDQAWRRFVEGVTTRQFRDLVARTTGHAVSESQVEVNLWEYGPDCWLSPHVDKPDKVVTIIYYLNPQWPAGNGGNLLILASSRPDDVVQRVRPVHGTGVILVRSDQSWHAVERVRDSEAAAVRRSVQIIFYREEV